MSSKSPNNTADILELVVDELTYLPSPEQRRAKSAFWARFSDNPICEPEDISLAVALRFSPDNRLSRWWIQPGFKEWFRNRDEFRQRMEYLANLALDSLEGILADPKAQGTAKVNAAKLIMEVARKTPNKSQAEQFLDEKVSQMSRPQLEEYIKKNLRLLDSASPPDVKSSSSGQIPTD